MLKNLTERIFLVLLPAKDLLEKSEPKLHKSVLLKREMFRNKIDSSNNNYKMEWNR